MHWIAIEITPNGMSRTAAHFLHRPTHLIITMSLPASTPSFVSPPASSVREKEGDGIYRVNTLDGVTPGRRSWEEKRYEKLPSNRAFRSKRKLDIHTTKQQRRSRRRHTHGPKYRSATPASFHDEDIEELGISSRKQNRLYEEEGRSSSPSLLSLDVERPPDGIDVGLVDEYLFSKRKPKSYDEALDDFVETGSRVRSPIAAVITKNLPHRVMQFANGKRSPPTDQENDGEKSAVHTVLSAVGVTGVDRKQLRQRRLCVGAILVLVVLIAVCSVYLAGLKDSGESQDDTNKRDTPRTSPPPRPVLPVPPEFNEDEHETGSSPVIGAWTETEIEQFVSSTSDAQLLEDSDSPQGQALVWLKSDILLKAPSSNVRVMQRYALAVLYYALGGSDGLWARDENWLSNEHECTWEGVACGPDGSDSFAGSTEDQLEVEAFSQIITVLSLQENNLRGSMPNELSALNDLGQLHLHLNSLTGLIPTNVFTMPRLHTLFLDNNNLTGVIPSTLGSRDALVHIDLSKNGLTGSIPNGVGNLVKLSDLRLSENVFTGEFPAGLIGLDNLAVIVLGYNQIQGTLPDAFGLLPNLATVHMHGNELFGSIPDFFSQHLAHLHLDDNALSGEIPEIAASSSLRELRLEQNEIGGTLPAALGNYEVLEILHLHSNKLVGTVPSEVGMLQDLVSLTLSANELTGTVPFPVCSLRPDKKLERLEATCEGSNSGLSCSCCDSCR